MATGRPTERRLAAAARLAVRCCRAVLAAVLLTGACAGAPSARPVILASTTSLYDSGLLDVLVAAFQATHDAVRVRIVAVGSGEALALGRRGDADVLLVHATEDELRFMQEGHGAERRVIMRNDFVIAGPADDPAGVRHAGSAAAALRRIAERGERFISRGDSSGTHRRELALWAAAGAARPRVTEVGQGMGETLSMASELRAYTLTDRATLVALGRSLELAVLLEQDPALANPYSVITVAGARNPAGAAAFLEWVSSADAAAAIAGYSVASGGDPLFVPLPH